MTRHVQDLLAERRALVADLRTCGSDRLTRATIEAQIKMIDGRLAEMRGGKVITAETLTKEQIHKLWSTTTDPQIAECCKSALGIGSPIWSVKQAAIEAVVEEINARGGK